MKMKIRDFLHEDVSIDVCDDYDERCYIAFEGPMWLTPEGAKEFAAALDLEVEYRFGTEIATLLVDRPSCAESERNAEAVYHLFYSLGGWDCTPEEYGRWFTVEKPETEPDDRAELIGQLIEIFEDFLDEKGITIPNEDKEDDPDAANIYGMDYGWLYGEIEQFLINRGLLKQEGE